MRTHLEHWPTTIILDKPLPPHFDGVIAQIPSVAIAKRLGGLKIPVVSVSQYVEHPEIPTVSVENTKVGRLAAEFFLERGFAHVAYCGNSDSYYSRGRLDGFRDRIISSKRDVSVSVLNLFDGESRQAKVDWLTELPKPVGVFAGNDYIAGQLANVCRDLGLLVPEQVSLLGVDNDHLCCRLVFPPLSSIDHGTHALGIEAARLLQNLFKGEPAPRTVRTVRLAGIVERQSTSILGVADPRVAKALRYIREKACSGISVEDVARHAGVSRRSLENAFRRHLERSVHEILLGIKLERVKKLLTNSMLSLADICEDAGFSYSSRLSAVFREQEGMTPSAYRKRYRDTVK